MDHYAELYSVLVSYASWGIYHYPKAQAAKQHLATSLPEDIEGLESVVKPVRSAIRSLHRLHAKHLEKISAKVSTAISYLIVKKKQGIGTGFRGLGLRSYCWGC